MTWTRRARLRTTRCATTTPHTAGTASLPTTVRTRGTRRRYRTCATHEGSCTTSGPTCAAPTHTSGSESADVGSACPTRHAPSAGRPVTDRTSWREGAGDASACTVSPRASHVLGDGLRMRTGGPICRAPRSRWRSSRSSESGAGCASSRRPSTPRSGCRRPRSRLSVRAGFATRCPAARC
jgi:hypothetical protein